ncbi:aspartate aminotransferase [Photobacterium swingsii]|uniref:cysteine-S-conjugate beta-lyase n=1 Tax=Photobacterium swingsii TaxID=680026 RepID=A0A0J8XZ87_9GAMM|nr:PatB family C-S lyase [Photobacterium swingsii]KMV30729.1 aspartate aminotransferase [Photobacterium swingsii]PSW26736.1 putative C-S lyase [Photobacterium swingsii]
MPKLPSHSLFDPIIERRHSNSIKWSKYADQDILPMWIADSDFAVPTAITDALHQRVDHAIFGYSHAPERLTQLIVDRMATRFNWQIEPEWIVYLPGLVCGINLCVRAFTDDQQGVVTPKPIYPPFMSSIKLAKRPLSTIPVTLQNQRWLPNLQHAELATNTKLMLLCNPLNPGGTVYNRQELTQTLAFAQQHDLLVCSDEIHSDLILDEHASHIPFASLNEQAAQRSVTLIAPSKTFNIAGLGASMAIIPNPELRRRFNKTKLGIVPDVNALAYTAAQAAYEHGEDWLNQQIGYLRENRALLTAEINAMPFLKLHPIEATYLAWIDASALPVPNPHTFFERAGVGMSPGADFGNKQFVRLNFACSRALLVEALNRMKTAITQLSAQPE